ncbi:MAG: hydrogenase nickel incorporation protein HypB [Chloroflexota bacterium]
MDEIRLIDVRKSILSDNENQAEVIRQNLAARNVFMLNLMASPGSGKTSLIIQTIRRLKKHLRIAVIEGDIESMVDSEKILSEGIPAVQIRTGGACHLDAPMVTAALDTLDLDNLDLVFIENIGNLICPAEFDIGADHQTMILSVPEGDDKILKYPLMFSICDALLVNKIDYLDGSDFNLELLHRRAHELNPDSQIFQLSCKTGSGFDEWCQWLLEKVTAKLS